jgi:hypothetical protein
VIQASPRDLLEYLVDPVTRVGVKGFKETLNELLQNTWAKVVMWTSYHVVKQHPTKQIIIWKAKN